MKRIHLILTICFLVGSIGSIAQGIEGNPVIENCYQRFAPESEGEYNLLTNGSNFDFTLVDEGGTFSFHGFTIWQLNSTTGSYDEVIFPFSLLTTYIWTEHPITGDDVYVEIYSLNALSEGVVHLDNGNPIIIDLWAGTTDPDGYTYYGNVLNNAKVNFVVSTEVFSAEPGNNQNCYTFDNFNFDPELSNIEGFCGTILYEIHTIGMDGDMGLPPGFSMEVNEFDTFELPVADEACADYNCTVHGSYPFPVPACCITMEIEVNIVPCINADIDCPTLTFGYPINVCCTCDGRPNNPNG